MTQKEQETRQALANSVKDIRRAIEYLKPLTDEDAQWRLEVAQSLAQKVEEDLNPPARTIKTVF